jgi:hypothetical protein
VTSIRRGAVKLAAALVVLAAPAAALAQSSPQTTMTSSVQLGKRTDTMSTTASAKIVSIDRAKRLLQLKLDDGKIVSVEAGPEIKNFAELKAGDVVHAEYVESITIQLKKSGATTSGPRTRAAIVNATPGESPAGAAAYQITEVAEVVGVNRTTQVVTLKSADGTITDITLKDPAQVANVSVGNHVEASYSEALALMVTPTQVASK